MIASSASTRNSFLVMADLYQFYRLLTCLLLKRYKPKLLHSSSNNKYFRGYFPSFTRLLSNTPITHHHLPISVLTLLCIILSIIPKLPSCVTTRSLLLSTGICSIQKLFPLCPTSLGDAPRCRLRRLFSPRFDPVS